MPFVRFWLEPLSWGSKASLRAVKETSTIWKMVEAEWLGRYCVTGHEAIDRHMVSV